MLAIAMIALFAAVAPVQEDVEQLENQEIVLSEECEPLELQDEYTEEEDSIVLEDVCEDMVEDTIAFSEE